MEKNKFLMINDLIYEIYLWKNISDIDESFFQRLKMIVPFEYASFFTMKLLIIRFLLASQFAFLLLFRRLNFNMLNLPVKMISCGFFTEKNPSLSVRVRYWTKNIVWILLSTVNVTENITFTTVYSVPLFFSRNFSAF